MARRPAARHWSSPVITRRPLLIGDPLEHDVAAAPTGPGDLALKGIGLAAAAQGLPGGDS